MRWKPSLWASLIPRNPMERKPNHYGEMLRAVWENRDQLPFAWRILNHGVCDGCALGTMGLKDWTIDGVHLCMVRLELMRLNTSAALDPSRLADVSAFSGASSQSLRTLGRLPEPMMRRRGEKGFRTVSWEEAYSTIAERIRATTPDRLAIYLTSRGMMNEHYYAAQKAARVMGTNHIDNSARLCHAASTVAMKRSLGHGASTCSYRDWIGTDLIVFFGSNVPNNQPVSMKYLYNARKQGTKVAVVNPYFEPGLKRYWVPSEAESALFGTKIADSWFAVNTGGDLPFLNGVFKWLVAEDWIARDFIAQHTVGFEQAKAGVEKQDWDFLEHESGATRQEMRRFAEMLRDAHNAIFVWSMGLTQHAHGVETIEALINVSLARGWLGREKTGLMPIRGHSGVQGGAEVGCGPNFDDKERERLERLWGFELPRFRGLTAPEMLAASSNCEIDVFWIVGGNFLETLPDPPGVAQALAKIGVRVHQDLFFSSMMLLPPRNTVVLLPATTRYESPGGGTETSTERRIIFSPEIPGRRIGTAKPEWEVFGEVAARVREELAHTIRFTSSQQIREEISKAFPLYAGIDRLSQEGDNFQWGGATLFADGKFATPDGKARFSVVIPKKRRPPDVMFYLSTRRAKQFNSMVQREIDPLTGASRDDVLISPEDARHLGIKNRDPIRLTSSNGSYAGRAKLDRIKPGNIEVHWPEGNCLLSRETIDISSGEPDYNAFVTLAKVEET